MTRKQLHLRLVYLDWMEFLRDMRIRLEDNESAFTTTWYPQTDEEFLSGCGIKKEKAP